LVLSFKLEPGKRRRPYVTDMSKQSRIESLEQCSQHFLDLEQLRLNAEMLSLLDHFQVAGEQKKILKFAGRAQGCVQKLPQFCLPPPNAPLCDVCWDGACRPANLTAHAEPLVGGQLTGYRVHLQHECMAAAPDIEFAEVLHDTPLFPASESNLLITNYLEPITESTSGGAHDH
jgi:hypothetical protein